MYKRLQLYFAYLAFPRGPTVINTMLAGFKSRRRRRQNVFFRALLIRRLREKIVKRKQIRQRSRDWWENIVEAGKLTPEEWVENFRMSQNTLELICNKLNSSLAPKPLGLHIYWRQKKALTVRKKVAVSLYFLASCAEYRVIGNQFGIHKSTVCKVIHEFVMAVNKILRPQFLKFPNSAEALQNSQIFESKCKIPNIIGAIDGTHIPILPPEEGYRDYINRKWWPSFILQAIVDPYIKFIDISIKHPGGSHDAAALESSKIYRYAERIFPKEPVLVNGRELPYVLVGDPAYPLLPWLLKGYSGPNLTPEEDSFNVHLNSARVVVELAFGRLKARWRSLLKRLDIHYSFVPDIIAACCTLHNIVETYKDDFNANWLQAVEEADILFCQPNPVNHERHELAGYDMRVFLTEYLRETFPLLSSRQNIQI